MFTSGQDLTDRSPLPPPTPRHLLLHPPLSSEASSPLLLSQSLIFTTVHGPVVWHVVCLQEWQQYKVNCCLLAWAAAALFFALSLSLRRSTTNTSRYSDLARTSTTHLGSIYSSVRIGRVAVVQRAGERAGGGDWTVQCLLSHLRESGGGRKTKRLNTGMYLTRAASPPL